MAEIATELAPLKRALDLALTIPPPHFGMDRKAAIARVEEINVLIDSRRKKRGLPLPARNAVRQLAELSGRDFVRQREDVLAKIQKHCEALEQAARMAPADLSEALAAIATSLNEAHALQQDAHEAWRSFHSGAYKAATVMAGTVLEGLVQQACAKLGERAHQAFATLHKGRAPKSALQFTVDEGLAVLRECGALSSALTHTAKGLKEMRNFVHPDLARKQKRAMQSTHALLALQALCTLADEIAWSLR
ncbi:MAG: hypothetical protein KBG84_01415 [Planctomycetes bacterium]|nr:hypothetical protein [Planctomycetota bacterium]